MTDQEFMREALALAERGRGSVEPNPIVGAVIVRNGTMVGRGWHAKFGGPHAEVVALAEAGEQAQGATLYVTLEPCAHHGKTPPCTDAILRAGITRVVAAMTDPFPEVAGKGIERLRTAGVSVEVGVEEIAAKALNRPYLTLLTHHRPYVHLKWAMTLDGRIATAQGDSKWISGEKSRQRVHELRGRMDGIIVGMGTVRADDPLLTARPPGPRKPTRIILSSKAEILTDGQLFRTADQSPIIVASCESRSIPGVELLKLPLDAQGRPSVIDLLAELGRRRFTNVLVEGGAQVFGSFLDAKLVDEVHIFIAPKIAGGENALSPIAGTGVDKIADALALSHCEVERIDQDIYVHGWR